MFGGLWRRIPGADLASKVGFISALLGIAGTGAYIFDLTREKPVPQIEKEQMTLIVQEILQKMSPQAMAAIPQPKPRGAIETVSTTDQVTSVKVGHQELNLTPPPGHCFYDPAEPSDARMIGFLTRIFSTDLRMLAGFADCAQLKLWRSGKRKVLDDHGQYLLPQGMIDAQYQIAPADLIPAICNAMRTDGQTAMDQVDADTKQRVKDAIHTAAINENKYLGVVDEDKNACYFALVQKLTTEFGDPKTQLGVTAATIAGGKVFTANLYSLYEGDLSLPELLEKQKANMARLARANLN